MKKSNALIVFIKNAVLGKVKTRLAAGSSPEFALQAYKHLRDQTLKEARATGNDLILYFSQHLPVESFGEKERVQKGSDLGERMQNAFEEVLAEYKKACIIGTDCPYLTTGIINEAFSLLRETDMVIGPARDGGYYLLGLTAPQPLLFQNILWSTSTVYEDTIGVAEEAGLSIAKLHPLSDIDHYEDWEEYAG